MSAGLGERWVEEDENANGEGCNRFGSSDLGSKTTPPRSFALRTRVARSGLLAVPGDLNMLRRFVCMSALSRSYGDREGVDSTTELPVVGRRSFFLDELVGVGGTTTGVPGWVI